MQMNCTWVWEIVTEDGHVAAQSAQFTDRDECEAAAILEGREENLPIAGITKPNAAQAKPGGLDVSRDKRGLWIWRYRGEDRKIVQKADRAFLTRKECVADAAAAGYR
jgi:hypothetical protein